MRAYESVMQGGELLPAAMATVSEPSADDAVEKKGRSVMNKEPYRIYLSEEEMPKQWYNIRADMKEQPDPYLHPATHQPVGPEDMLPIFCEELCGQELNTTDRYIDIPEEVQNFYRIFRPSPLIRAYNLEKALDTPAKIYYKFEGNNTSGSHKLNSAAAQVYYAKKQGLKSLTTETGAGQWGTALAMACSHYGLDLTVYMVKVSYEQKPFRKAVIHTFGADIIPSPSDTTEVGRAILKAHPGTGGSLGCAISEAIEKAMHTPDCRYVLGSVMGPHPFPMIVRDFQSVISKEARAQILEKEGRLPAAVVACVGGGSNAMGMFYNFIGDEGVRLIGCEAAGRGIDTFETAATVNTGRVGIFHGMKSYFCQDAYGQIAPVYSISAGLDYPGVGPEHAYLHDTGRAVYVPVTDEEAVCAFAYLAKTEGIIPAIESAHAVAYAQKLASKMGKDQSIVITISGRGDKDCAAIARYRGENIYE